jgi:anaerobic magnesium-protoporphyrin IX monomethyl ester cyclase
MKILLIAPTTRYKFIDPPLGLSYLKAAAERSGLGASITILDLNQAGEGSIDELQVLNYHVAGVTVTKPLVGEALGLARHLRQRNPSLILIAGGAEPSIHPDAFLTDFDIVVRGEGEQTLIEVLRNLGENLSAVEGISFRQGDYIQHNPPRPLISNLDGLPFPSPRFLLGYPEYQYQGSLMAPIFTSRGCPYECIFCNKEVFGHKLRYRSPANIIAEMNLVYRETGIQVFQFRDDLFTISRTRVLDLCRALIERDAPYTWLCNTRVDRIDPDLLGRMYTAGCRRVSFGVETGDPDLLIILNKKTTIQQAIDAANWTHAAGMKVKFYLMVGIPGQTRASIEKTKDLIRLARPDEIYCSVFLPFPGTKAWEQRQALGIKLLFDPNDISAWDRIYYQSNLDFEEAEPPVETTLMSRDDIISARRDIFYTFRENMPDRDKAL